MTTPQLDPATELRAAAQLLRERSSAATSAPWSYDPDKMWNLPGMHYGEEFVGHRREGERTVCVAGTGPADDPQSMADAAWIALMHPGLGEPIAAWLERTADYYRPGTTHPTHVVRALAVARALLGGAS